MNRYSRLDNQSPAVEAMEANDINVGRSAHDCSHIVNGNAMIGMLAPVLTMECVLNEDVDINLASLIEYRNPTTRKLFNSFRVYFHGYFNALTDLWEGAKNWLDKGRSGTIDLSRPNLIYNVNLTPESPITEFKVNACTPMSLLNFLGMPVEMVQSNYGDNDETMPPIRYFQTGIKISGARTYKATKVGESTSYFPADVCMAYQRNWRDFYCNKNLLQNNKFWFPDNEDHFILSYSCENAVCINYEDEDLDSYSSTVPVNKDVCQAQNLFGYVNLPSSLVGTPEPNNPTTSDVPNPFVAPYFPNLSGIKFRQFRGDRFTTASPFPDLLRGDIPSLLLNNSSLEKLSVKANTESPSSGSLYTWNENYVTDSGFNDVLLGAPSTGSPDGVSMYVNNPLSTVTMSDIYTLETLTAFKRKMGMTNGDYSEMMQAQFGVKPKVHSHRGTYIGGFYQDFALSSVVQQSESGSTPLGTKAGQGVSSGSGRIGHFHTTDFGWISVYMSIMPDVYYTQGKPRQYSKKSNLEMYFPIFNNLPAQGIRNDELYISGNATTDATPFAYEDRYAEFKSIPNRVTGLMGLPVASAPFDTARVIARRFTSTPSLNSLFVTAVPENIDMSVFSVVDEPPFDFSIGFSIRRVFPGPYTAIEGSLSSPKLNS